LFCFLFSIFCDALGRSPASWRLTERGNQEGITKPEISSGRVVLTLQTPYRVKADKGGIGNLRLPPAAMAWGVIFRSCQR